MKTVEQGGEYWVKFAHRVYKAKCLSVSANPNAKTGVFKLKTFLFFYMIEELPFSRVINKTN